MDSNWAGSAIDRKRTSGCCSSMRSERSSEAPVCDPDRDISKEGVHIWFSYNLDLVRYSIVGEP